MLVLLGNQKILYKLKGILLHVALPTQKEVEHFLGLFEFYIRVHCSDIYQVIWKVVSFE